MLVSTGYEYQPPEPEQSSRWLFFALGVVFGLFLGGLLWI